MERHCLSFSDRPWQVLSSPSLANALQTTARAHEDMDGDRCTSSFSFVLPRIGRLILRTGSSTRASLRLLGEVPVRHYRRKGNQTPSLNTSGFSLWRFCLAVIDTFF